MNWISVNEKLPDNDEVVLVYNPEDGISIGEFDLDSLHGYWEDDKTYTVTNSGWETDYHWAPHMSPTHWMPLPEEPKD